MQLECTTGDERRACGRMGSKSRSGMRQEIPRGGPSINCRGASLTRRPRLPATFTFQTMISSFTYHIHLAARHSTHTACRFKTRFNNCSTLHVKTLTRCECAVQRLARPCHSRVLHSAAQERLYGSVIAAARHWHMPWLAFAKLVALRSSPLRTPSACSRLPSW